MVLTDYNIVIKNLETVREIVIGVLKMPRHTRELKLLAVFIHLLKEKDDSDFDDYIGYFECLEKEYQKKEHPEFSDYTLFHEINTELPGIGLPEDYFSQCVTIYRIYDILCKEYFDKARESLAEKTDLMMLDKLKRIVRNTLVDNPNFKSLQGSPYYKKNESAMMNATKSWIQQINKDFDDFISYFKG